MTSGKRDASRTVVAMGETNDANRTPTAFQVDPTTKRVLVDLDSKGDTGTTGTQGDTGVAGAKGDTGVTGDTGVVGASDHGTLTGLADDDHTQYVLLVGRTSGQTIIGGTTTTADLTLQTTSGVGATGADMHFLVGNNGATEAMTILNNGNVGIGTTGPLSSLSISTVANLTNVASRLSLYNLGLANTAGSYLYPFEIQSQTSGSQERLQFTAYRRIAGSDWQGTSYRIQTAVDGSFTDGSKAYIELGQADSVTSGGGFISFGTAGSDRLSITNAGNVGIGTTSPVGKLDIVTTATNDDPTYSVRQARIATTDATATTLQTIAITASNTYLIEARVVARRTGGTAGTADDGAAYIVKGAYTTKSGTVTLLGSLTVDHSAEDVAGYDATLVISGTNVILQVQGVADTNITWHTTSIVQMVGT